MIRVLRILEYSYPDYETAEEDMKNWQVPPWGSKQFGDKMIYSAILPATVELMKDQL